MSSPQKNETPDAIRHSWIRNLSWATFFLLIWQILLAAQNPGLMTDDSGEIVTAAVGLGICHAPGYPLYSLLGRLFSLVPVGTPAFRLNLMASLFTLGGILFLLLACRSLMRRFGLLMDGGRAELLLASTALSLLFCRSVFAQSLTSKGGLYTLLLMNLAVIIKVLLSDLSRFHPEWILFFWAVGLGAHGQTQVLWIVLILLGLRRTHTEWSFRRIAAAFSFILIGLSPLLYLPLRAGLSPALNHLDPRSYGAFLDLLRRADTPGHDFILKDPLAFGRVGLKYLEIMTWHWWPGFLLLAVLGFGFLLRRQRPLASNLLIQYALLIGMIVLASFFNEPVSLYLFGNILVSTQVIPALGGAIGSAFLLDRLGRRRGIAALLATLIGLAAWGGNVFRQQDKSRYTLSSDYGSNLMRETPRDAVLAVDDDLSVLPCFYLHHVMGMRPDIVLVPLYALHAPWGIRELAERYPDRRTKPGDWSDFTSAVACLADPGCFRSGGFMTTYSIDVLERRGLADLAERLTPRGLSYRLSPPGLRASDVSGEVWTAARGRRLRRLLETPDLQPTEYTVKAYLHEYARPHAVAGLLLLRAGDLSQAWRHFEAALAIDPRARGVQRGLAAHFATEGYLELAARFGALAASENADPEDLLLYANILLKNGKWTEAAETYGKVLRRFPASEEATARLDMALSFRSQGAPEGWVRTRGRDDYRRLALELEHAGMSALADAARAAGDSDAQ